MKATLLSSPRPATRTFRLAAILLLFSGAASLGHQLVWTRRMMDLIGATGESNARVFGCFFLGLSLGSAYSSWLIPKIQRPWRILAFIEFGAALLCLPILLLPSWSAHVWPLVGPEKLLRWQGAAVKLALSILLVVPPTFFMGLFMPVLASCALQLGGSLDRQGIWLYAFNTFGGIFGLTALLAFTLQLAGADGSIAILMLLDIAVGMQCLLKDRHMAPQEAKTDPNPIALQPPLRKPPFYLSLGLSFASGVGTLAVEVLCVQVVNLVAPVCFYPAGVVLLSVILLLAVSALLVPTLVSKFRRPDKILPPVFLLAGLAIALFPVLFINQPINREHFGSGKTLWGFFVGMMGPLLFALGPAILIGGAVFPLVISSYGPIAGREAGRRLGLLLAVNGLGGIVGAETAIRFLAPNFGYFSSVGVIAVAYELVALFLVLSRDGRNAVRLLAPLVGIIITCWITKTRLAYMLHFFSDPSSTVLQILNGRAGSLAVVQNPRFGKALIFNNAYFLGSEGAQADEEREAHLPLLLHQAPRDVAFLGLGTGITAGAALLHQPVKSVTVLELSSEVARAADEFFQERNHNICHDPSAKVYVEDARIYIAASPNRFDVIIGDLFTPWRPGEAGLCSLEAFQASRRALRDGGLFCQWLPMHQLTPRQFELILSTFNAVFSKAYIFVDNLKGRSLPLALIGFNGDELRWDVLAQRCAQERSHGRVLDPTVRHPEGVAMLYLGESLAPKPPQDAVNTLGNLRIELGASLQLVAGDASSYYASANGGWAAFVETRLATIASDPALPPALHSLPALGFSFLKAEIAAVLTQPNAEAQYESALRQLPAAMLSDRAADWSLWAADRTPPTMKDK